MYFLDNEAPTRMLAGNNGGCWRLFGSMPLSFTFVQVFNQSSSQKRKHKDQLPLDTLRNYFQARKKQDTF
jgi:hypothetical protein